MTSIKGKVSIADKMRIQTSTRLLKTSQSDWRLVLKLAVDTSNIHSDNGILTSDHSLTVLFKQCYWIDVVAWTLLNAGKSVGGHVYNFAIF